MVIYIKIRVKDIKMSSLNLSNIPVAIIACSGARSLSIIQALAKNSPEIPIYNHFEEREASFFALGLSKKYLRPCIVICTSGTAVAECFAAVIEAYYSGTQLVIVSADRPLRYQGTGAPQTIIQEQIFGSYVQTKNLVNESNPVEQILPFINSTGPTHINISVDEFESIPDSENFNIDSVDKFLNISKNPIVIVGSLSESERVVVKQFLKRLKSPCLLEAHSGLREDKDLDVFSIKSGDLFVSHLLKNNIFDGVLRIGSVPTTRVWREIEFFDGPVLSISKLPFSGSPSSQLVGWNFNSTDLNEKISTHSKKIIEIDNQGLKILHKLFYSYPLSEPALIHKLSHVIHENDRVFIGNSLPIREWDLAASRKTPHSIIETQRGANGIDGQISNFLGGADKFRHNWGIFGDLTFLYGSTGLWALKFLEEFSITFIIIQNYGGQIFSRINKMQKSFTEDPTLKNIISNPHNINLKGLCETWGLEYKTGTDFNSDIRSSKKQLIEIVVDEVQTKNFYAEWEQYWRDL